MNVRRGFTLMEVILATFLSAVLLLSLWGVFGTYLRMFESGQQRTLHSQLIRGLRQQFADDLASAIQDTADIPSGSNLNAVRRFGMFGTARELQLDIMQPVPIADSSTTAAGGNLLVEAAPASQAFELRTIHYSLRPLTDLDEIGMPAQPGLVRQEFGFQSPPETAAASQQGNESSNQLTWTDASASDMPDVSSPEELLVLGQSNLKADDDQVTWVPEVVAIEFRYYDGAEWNSTWNSLQRKSLPVAVEAVIQLASLDDTASRTSAADRPEQDPSSTSDILRFDDRGAIAKGTIFRVLINLSKSALRRDTGPTNAWAPTDAGDELLDEPQWPTFADDRTLDIDDPLAGDGPMGLSGPTGDGGPMGGEPDPGAPPPSDQGFGLKDRLRSRWRAPSSTSIPTPDTVQPLTPDVWMRR